MNETMVTSPYIAAESYRVGQIDGFKAGVAAGVVAMVLIKSLRQRKNTRPPFWQVKKNSK